MTNWTPGPWLVDNTTIYTLRPCKWLGLDSFENAWQAQFSQDGRHETSISEVKANAVLASAAPELYKALESLSDLILTLNPDVGGHILNAVNKADSALAKARGE